MYKVHHLTTTLGCDKHCSNYESLNRSGENLESSLKNIKKRFNCARGVAYTTTKNYSVESKHQGN